MPNLLGLTLEPNVIGWSLLDAKSKKIKAMGSHVFPIGNVNFGSGRKELSKQSFRRTKRIARVALARNRKRKIKVLQILIKNKMCPLGMEELKLWQQTKEFPTATLKSWFQMNPYALRKKALEPPLSLEELGRIIYQISIHRGFPTKDRFGSTADNAIYVGIPASQKPGILHTQNQIANCTLGVYLEGLLPEEGNTYRKQNERVRNRFLSRDMFQNELHIIWNFQAQFHSTLTEELKIQIIGQKSANKHQQGAVFYQRPLKSQKFRVGKCELEKTKTKCSISDLTYQEMLAYQWANQLKKNGAYLDEIERHKAAHYFMTKKRFSFKRFRFYLEEVDSIFNYKDDEIIKGSFIHATLSDSEIFGNGWFSFSDSEKEILWHKLHFFDNKDKLKENLILTHQLGYRQASKIAQINLDRRYAPLSKKASKNILFFLKKGLVYNMAVILAGVKSSLGASWENIASKDVDYIIRTVLNLYKSNKGMQFAHALNTFLTEEMELTSIQYAKLYGVYRSYNTLMLKSKYEVSPNADREINNLRVPLLKTVVFQMRKLLNLLIDTYGPIDEIKASLSIDLKINKYQRYLYRLDQKRLEGLRETYMQKLGAMAENLTPLNLTKYELWKECKNTCPYTGKYIPLEELFSDRIKVVYIHPWEWSLNDSILNKTLCDASLINQIKSKTPVEYFQENAPEHWEGVVKRAARLFSNTKEFPSSYKKFKRFVKRYNKRNVFKHLMDDPNAITRKIQHYLERVVPKVGVSAGHTNALFIEKWQLKKVFEPSVYERYDLDWRFAAFDAYINANRELHYFEILVEQNKYLPRSKKINFPIPYDDFREDLNYHLHSILVSHKKDSRILSTRHKMVSIDKTATINKEVSVRGSLHKESIYGLRQQPHSELKSFHIRKPIESFTTLKQVEKVVDPVVKSIMLKTILDHNGFNGDIIPRNAFSDFSQSGKKFHKVFMPNAKGDPVPIKKVRIRENLTGTAKLKQNLNQHVNLRKNHHVVIYKDNTGKYQEYITSFWEAVQRARKKEPIFQMPQDGEEFVTTLEINDLFILGIDDLSHPISGESKSFISKHLYRVQKLSNLFYEFRLASDNNLKNLDAPSYIRINNFGNRKTGWLTYNPIKVKIDLTGNWVLDQDPIPKQITKSMD